jgi:hypothetical protein
MKKKTEGQKSRDRVSLIRTYRYRYRMLVKLISFVLLTCSIGTGTVPVPVLQKNSLGPRGVRL